MVPHVESLESDALPRDQRMAGTTNAKIDLGGVVAERRRLLARLQDREPDLDAGGKARRIGLGERMHDQRFAPAVPRRGQARQPLDFRIDLALGDDDRRPIQVLVPRALTGAVGEATLHVLKILRELAHGTSSAEEQIVLPRRGFWLSPPPAAASSSSAGRLRGPRHAPSPASAIPRRERDRKCPFPSL